MKLFRTLAEWLVNDSVDDEAKLVRHRFGAVVIDGSWLARVVDALVVLLVMMYLSWPDVFGFIMLLLIMNDHVVDDVYVTVGLHDDDVKVHIISCPGTHGWLSLIAMLFMLWMLGVITLGQSVTPMVFDCPYEHFGACCTEHLRRLSLSP